MQSIFGLTIASSKIEAEYDGKNISKTGLEF
jgi:hypothetical protein